MIMRHNPELVFRSPDCIPTLALAITCYVISGLLLHLSVLLFPYLYSLPGLS